MLRDSNERLHQFKSQMNHLDGLGDFSPESSEQKSESQVTQTKVQVKMEKKFKEADTQLQTQISELFIQMQSINCRTLKFFKRMKQLVFDHYGWLKTQK